MGIGLSMVCRECGEEKPWTVEFFEKTYNKNFLRRVCRKCNNEHRKQWHRDNPDYNKKRQNNLYHTDILYKTSQIFRSRLDLAIKQTWKAGHTTELLGCTIEKFIKYIEAKFQPGMSWENWNRNGWHLDHIKPIASFDLRKKDEQKKCCRYTNFQPLWAKDNISKGKK